MANHTVTDWRFKDGIGRIWATIAGYPGWTVDVTAMPTSSGLVIADLRVYPEEWNTGQAFNTPVPDTLAASKMPPGHDWSGDPQRIPPGGVLTRILRKVNAGELLEHLQHQALIESQEHQLAAARAILEGDSSKATCIDQRGRGIGVLAATPRRRPGKLGHGVEHYLRWAVRYAEKVNSGSRHPIADLAVDHLDELGGDVEKARVAVRDTVTDARRRYRLLTDPPGQGKPGGQLTPEARAMLAEQGD